MVKQKTLPIWHGQKKEQAWEETIAQQLFQKTHKWSIPKDRQLVTLSGLCAEDGKLLSGCEYDRATRSFDGRKPIISDPSQFVGIDYDPEIIKANRKVCPDAKWLCGDFYESLCILLSENNLSPLVVNADFTCMPAAGCGYLASIMNLLSFCPGPILLVGNMVLSFCHVRNTTIDEAVDSLYKEENFKAAMNSGWVLDDEWYWYKGTGKSGGTCMASLIFFKK